MPALTIAVAGPYSAPTAGARRANLDRMNLAAAALLRARHTPIIEVNAALPIVELVHPDPADRPPSPERNAAIMAISMAVIDGCDAILHLSSSPGADRERDHLLAKSKLVYTSLAEIPGAG